MSRAFTPQHRRSLENRTLPLRQKGVWSTPKEGWLRAVRDAIGMTATQAGKRQQVSHAQVTYQEQAELRGSLTLASLERAAEALGCRLVYALVPETSLEEALKTQARKKAQAMVARTNHSMQLDNQPVSEAEMEKQIQDLTDKLLQGSPARLWDED